MTATRPGTALCILGSIVAAAALSSGCDAVGGGGGGGGGGEVTAEQLEVTPALRAVCGDISEGEIESILQEVAEQWSGGTSRAQATAESLIACNTSPPGG